MSSSSTTTPPPSPRKLPPPNGNNLPPGLLALLVLIFSGMQNPSVYDQVLALKFIELQNSLQLASAANRIDLFHSCVDMAYWVLFSLVHSSNIRRDMHKIQVDQGYQLLTPALTDNLLHLLIQMLGNGQYFTFHQIVESLVQSMNDPRIDQGKMEGFVRFIDRAGCLEVPPTAGQFESYRLAPTTNTIESIRQKVDKQVMANAYASGVYLTAIEWSTVLYGDDLHEVAMQDLMDEYAENHDLFLEMINKLNHLVNRSPQHAPLMPLLDPLRSINESELVKDPTRNQLVSILQATVNVVNIYCDHMRAL